MKTVEEVIDKLATLTGHMERAKNTQIPDYDTFLFGYMAALRWILEPSRKEPPVPLARRQRG